MTRSIRIPLSTLAVPFLLACGGGDTPRVALRDSAGVTIVENLAPVNALYRVVDPEPVLEIGGSGASEDEFSQVQGLQWLGDGGVAVAERATQDIRIFGPDGRWRATAGRRGGGPGEFEGLAGIWVMSGDTVLAYDFRHRRFSRFTGSGELLDETALETGGPMFVQPVGRLRDGRFLFRATTMVGTGNQRSGLTRPPALVLLYDRAGRMADTVGEFAGSEALIQVDGQGGQVRSVSFMTLPFGRNTRLVAVEDHLLVAPGDGYELRRYRLDGALHRIIRRSHDPRPVGDADVERYLQDLADRGSREFVDRMRQPLMEAPRPDAMPAHGSVIAGPEGQLWVEDFSPPGLQGPVRWSVFDPEGRWLGEVELPDRFRPYQVTTDRVLGVWQDPDDVPYVRVYRLLGM